MIRSSVLRVCQGFAQLGVCAAERDSCKRGSVAGDFVTRSVAMGALGV